MSRTILLPTLTLLAVASTAGCLFFDSTVYCDSATPCADGTACNKDGTCAGSNAEGEGEAAEGEGEVGEGEGEGDPTPTAPVLEIAPSSPRTLDDLALTITTPSVAPAAVTYTVRWTRDGFAQNALDDAYAVPNAETAKTQVWVATVTPTAGGLTGPPGTATVTIQNTPPSLRGVSLRPPHPRPGEEVTATPIGFFDPDPGDPPLVEYRWFVVESDGSIDQQTGVTGNTYDVPFQGDGYFVTVIPRDQAAPGGAGDPVSSCQRPSPGFAPRWRSHHPTELFAEGFGGGYLIADPARDRVVMFAEAGRDDEDGALPFELTFGAGPRFASLEVPAPATFVFLRAAAYVPHLDGLLQVGGLNAQDSTPLGDVRAFELGQGCENARPLTIGGAPLEPVAGGSLIWDPIAERAIHLFGLESDGVDFVGATAIPVLQWDGLAFNNAAPLVPSGAAPLERVAARAFYDGAHHQAVVYGGLTPDVASGNPAVFLGDAYVLSLDAGSETWRALNLPGAPAPLVESGVGLWPAGNAFVLIGGCESTGTCAAPTDWSTVHALDLTPGAEAWSTVPITPPLSGLVIDSVFREETGTFILLTRDETATNNRAFRIEELTPGTTEWTAATVFSTDTDLPAARARHAGGLSDLFGDAQLLITHGGDWDVNYGFEGELRGDSWALDTETEEWTLLQAVGDVPSARAGMAFAGDSPNADGEGRGLPLLMFGGLCGYVPDGFGGSDPVACDSLHRGELSGATITWTAWTGGALPPARIGAGAVGTSGGVVRSMRVLSGRRADGQVVVQDDQFNSLGSPPYFTAGTWQPGATGAPGLFDAAVTERGDFSANTLAVSFGGRSADFTITDELWASPLLTDGTDAWVQSSATPRAPARAGASMTFVDRAALLIFGGSAGALNELGDLWMIDTREADPDLWVFHDYTAEAAGPVPAARAFHTAHYDPNDDVLWIFGGRVNGQNTGQLWSVGPISRFPIFP